MTRPYELFPVNQAKVQQALDQCPQLAIAVARFRARLHGGPDTHPLAEEHPLMLLFEPIYGRSILEGQWAEWQRCRLIKDFYDTALGVPFDAFSPAHDDPPNDRGNPRRS